MAMLTGCWTLIPRLSGSTLEMLELKISPMAIKSLFTTTAVPSGYRPVSPTRIAPGVLSVPQGAWYCPLSNTKVAPPSNANPKQPVDINGAMNTLTSLHPSPLAKGNAVHTTIANVEKA